MNVPEPFDLTALLRPVPTSDAGRFTLDVPDGLQQGRAPGAELPRER